MPPTQSDLAPLDGKKRWAFLEQAKTIRLATAADGAAIHVSPQWFVVRDETVFIPLDAQEKHPETIAAGGRVSGVVDEGDEITNFRAVILEGRAKAVTDKALGEELLDLLLEKYFYHGHPHLEHYLSTGAVAARRWYQLVPDRVDGWDRRELPQAPIDERRVLPPHLRKKR